MILIGSAVWAVVLMVVIALGLAGRLADWHHPAQVCLAGMVLGGFGVLWERRRRARIARDSGPRPTPPALRS